MVEDVLDGLEGLFLHGEYLGLRDRKPREVGERVFVNCDLGLRVHGSVVAVQYPSRAAALDGLEAAGFGDSPVGGRVAIRVVQRSGSNARGPWSFYAGVVSGTGPSEDDFTA